MRATASPCDRIPSCRSVESVRTAGVKVTPIATQGINACALVVPRGYVVGELGVVFVEERIDQAHGGHAPALPLRIHQGHEGGHHGHRGRSAIDVLDISIKDKLVVVSK